ncbi:MAG TPA: VOC family protein [Ilumatobacteraceae bacterium]|nr:VOC family protein [Ilumatobacteraceae bacterium]
MTSSPSHGPAVLQLRLIVEAEDYDAAVAFYRDTLGLTEQAAFEGEGGARVAILEAGRATLEIANPAQKRMIDEVEVGRPVSPKIRVAFEVADSTATTAELVAAGATLIAPPTATPWQSLNSRLEAPAGLQITLFQELESLEDRTRRAGFGTDAERHESP